MKSRGVRPRPPRLHLLALKTPLAPVPRLYLRATEVAAALGISRWSLYKLMEKDPTFPRPHYPILPTGHPRWPVRDLEAWVKLKSEEAARLATPNAPAPLEAQG